MIFNMSTGGASTADKIKYDNTESGLQSTNVQGAVDELNNSLGGLKFGTDGEGNYGYFGDDDVLIPFSSLKSLKVLTAENPSSDTYSFNGYTVECSATSLYGSSYPARYAFINTYKTWAPSKGSTNQYATIKFSIEVNVKLVKIEEVNETGVVKSWKLQYSDDGVNFNDIDENIIYLGTNYRLFSCDPGAHMYYRLYQGTGGTGHCEILGDY